MLRMLAIIGYGLLHLWYSIIKPMLIFMKCFLTGNQTRVLGAKTCFGGSCESEAIDVWRQRTKDVLL
jgi:hypothetical protein